MKKIFKQITMAALVLGIVLNMASLSYAATVAQYRLALDACNQKMQIYKHTCPLLKMLQRIQEAQWILCGGLRTERYPNKISLVPQWQM